ncbi:MAG: sigma-54 interaction domain-containing protein [Desulfobaccales bacterium]
MANFWEKVLATMLEGVAVIDAKGIIQAANPALEEITGYSRDELIGQSCALIRSTECFSASQGVTREQCRLFQSRVINPSRCVLARKDGSLKHVLKQAVLLQDEADQILGGIEIFLDISESVAQERLIAGLRRELRQEDGFQGILGKSLAMLQLFTLMRSVGRSEAPVLIFGESGTGKEMVARALHRLGPRSQGPFISVNCRVLPETLLDSELFGVNLNPGGRMGSNLSGQFAAAQGGTLFLDEVGSLPLPLQGKFLQVFREQFPESGGSSPRKPPEVRLITATSLNPHHLIREGRLLEELFYRLNVIPIQVPPLRERREDIPLLASAFIERARLKAQKAISGLSPDALERLSQHAWPGNVRELINVVDYAVVVCSEGPILPEHLPPYLSQAGLSRRPESSRRRAAWGGGDQESLVRALKQTGGRMGAAAEMLGISRVTLWKWLKKYNLKMEDILASR